MYTRNARTGRMRARLPSLLAVLTLLAGLGITAVLFLDTRAGEQARARAEFTQFASARSAAIVRGFEDALHVLHASSALLAAVGEVDRAQFGAFVQPLLASHPYVQAVALERLVGAEERAAYERRQSLGRPGFRIQQRAGDGLVPVPARPRHLVVEYIEPAAGNEVVLGYDALSFDEEHRAFLRALESGKPVSTRMLPLVQRTDQLGIVVVQPFYRRGARPADAAARRAAVAGDTAVVIDVAGMAAATLSGARMLDRAGMRIDLLGPRAGGPALAFRNDAMARTALPAWHGWLDATVFTTTKRFEVAGQPWELRLRGRSNEIGSAAASLTVLLLGSLVSLATAAYVQARVLRTRRIEALVDTRTADLRDALADLRLYRRATDASANAVILVSATRPGLPIVHVNPAFERMRGFSANEALGRSLIELGEKEPDQAAVAELGTAMRERREGHASMRLRCKDRRELHAEVYIAPVNDRDGNTTHFVINQYDVTMAKRYEAELESHARFDTLTGLANRSMLYDRIESALNFSGGRPSVWVAALDLDHFKCVNDTLGHEAGDRLLRAVAQRIAGTVERSDTVARTGGDEFVLVLPGRADEGEAAITVRAVLAALAHPLVLDGQELVLTDSAGVAGFPSDGNGAATLIQHAEVAMYRAKETGRNTVQFYIEITESMVMEGVEGAIRTMGELKRMGVKLSIDDFGTGYSSLSYLRRFPVDVLKIDRSFVRDIAFSEDDAAMVSAIIELARGLRIRTIAEGVETEAQLDYLKRRGCDEVQGHVYSKAAPRATVEVLLRNGRRVEPHRASA